MQSTEGRAWYRAVLLREELGLAWGKRYEDAGQTLILQASIPAQDDLEAGDQDESDSLPT